MLEALVEKFGVDAASLAALGLERSDQKSYIPVNSVMCKLIACKDTGATKQSIEEVFCCVFPQQTGHQSRRIIFILQICL